MDRLVMALADCGEQNVAFVADLLSRPRFIGRLATGKRMKTMGLRLELPKHNSQSHIEAQLTG
jgi:hypothetical protein